MTSFHKRPMKGALEKEIHGGIDQGTYPVCSIVTACCNSKNKLVSFREKVAPFSHLFIPKKS